MTPPTACPAWPGVGDKTAASLLLSYGDLSGIRAAAADPGSALGPGPRGKIIAASDYLDVAPTVVAVARDIDLGTPDTTLAERAAATRRPSRVLAERWGLSSPVERLTGVLKRR